MAKESQSDTDLKGSVICAPTSTTQLEEKNRESEKPSKTERSLSGESGKAYSTRAVITAVAEYYNT